MMLRVNLRRVLVGLLTFVRKGRVWKTGIVILLVMALLVIFFPKKTTSVSRGTTYTVKRGPLRISVIEGGTIEAAESQTSKSEIKGQTKILSIIEEGYQVTEQDVRDGKILVRLDDSNLLEQKTQQEMQYQTALARYTEAKEQYEIQVKQNESDIKSAELEVKFARMDFEKYLGEQVAGQILKELEPSIQAAMEMAAKDLEPDLLNNQDSAVTKTEQQVLSGAKPSEQMQAAPLGNSSSTSGEGKGETAPSPEKETGGTSVELSESEGVLDASAKATIESAVPQLELTVDFTKYADADLLGDGEAQQKLKTLQNARMLAEEELKLAETNFEGTKRLKERNFVTQQELDADEMKVKRLRNAFESASIEESLFIKYGFPKQAEKLLATYLEALRKYERTTKLAKSKLAQAEAQWKSAEATFQLQKTKRDDVLQQIEKCVIRAERPGLVVYAGSNQPWRGDRIEEGAVVREGQEIITIPDMTQMTVNVKVHESSIKKVQKGQKALITLDAYPDEKLQGEVTKLSVLPDSSMRWMNPDIKLYPVTVAIDGVHEWLKPGLTANTEIIIKELQDVLFVPIQAVSVVDGQRVCYVVNALGVAEQRVVKTGEMSADFVEILEGLEEGETVLLRAPTTPEEKAKPKTEKRDNPPEKPQGVPSNGVAS
ncbi:MAG TPA: efflux RND transporter periplasmic adaptor subunit [Candidatus Hydrogenedentes bacterium]|nr:efflux RND transporter periplasmic adaptor subunit [Candidatus Hydrogenedentota bacterium]HOL78224.1 efflux RND transporter periplasmic adaptor subunit [Candidatus Hydrogenedentota bacterium]HPO84529.1 efflux RND transporter periplasmic adaptor subunit [Candidatus Hydrogenedentota bacterium]